MAGRTLPPPRDAGMQRMMTEIGHGDGEDVVRVLIQALTNAGVCLGNTNSPAHLVAAMQQLDHTVRTTFRPISQHAPLALAAGSSAADGDGGKKKKKNKKKKKKKTCDTAEDANPDRAGGDADADSDIDRGGRDGELREIRALLRSQLAGAEELLDLGSDSSHDDAAAGMPGVVQPGLVQPGLVQPGSDGGTGGAGGGGTPMLTALPNRLTVITADPADPAPVSSLAAAPVSISAPTVLAPTPADRAKAADWRLPDGGGIDGDGDGDGEDDADLEFFDAPDGISDDGITGQGAVCPKERDNEREILKEVYAKELDNDLGASGDQCVALTCQMLADLEHSGSPRLAGAFPGARTSDQLQVGSGVNIMSLYPQCTVTGGPFGADPTITPPEVYALESIPAMRLYRARKGAVDARCLWRTDVQDAIMLESRPDPGGPMKTFPLADHPDGVHPLVALEFVWLRRVGVIKGNSAFKNAVDDSPYGTIKVNQAVLLDQFQDLGDESHKEETGVGASNPYFSICHVQWVFGKGTRVTGRNSAARTWLRAACTPAHGPKSLPANRALALLMSHVSAPGVLAGHWAVFNALAHDMFTVSLQTHDHKLFIEMAVAAIEEIQSDWPSWTWDGPGSKSSASCFELAAMLGETLASRNDHNGAAFAFEQALRVAPTKLSRVRIHMLHTRIGAQHQARKDFTGAQKAYEAAMAVQDCPASHKARTKKLLSIVTMLAGASSS